MKRAIVSVINDLSTDQRVHKVCTTLVELGYEVTLVGRWQRKSMPLKPRNYATKRMFLVFEKGPLFYFIFQKRLFWYLLVRKADVLVANDLDTLMPNYLVAKLKRSHLVYDSHELFCEVPELQHHATKKRIWKTIEQWLFPKLRHVFTVNKSIADIYGKEYHTKVNVVRNVPMMLPTETPQTITKRDLGIDDRQSIIVLQGAGINIDRGAEEAVAAMQYVENATLLIIGSGDVIDILKQNVKQLGLENKVRIMGKLPFDELMQYTRLADLGLTLDKDTNINYKYSLPNKLFDYIHAGVPVLSSDLVEIKNILMQYEIGDTIANHSPEHIAEKINQLLNDKTKLAVWKKNTTIATRNLNWEKETERLRQVYKSFL